MAQIHISIPLLQHAQDPAKQGFDKLTPDAVSEYLTANLHWKATVGLLSSSIYQYGLSYSRECIADARMKFPVCRRTDRYGSTTTNEDLRHERHCPTYSRRRTPLSLHRLLTNVGSLRRQAWRRPPSRWLGVSRKRYVRRMNLHDFLFRNDFLRPRRVSANGLIN